MKIINMISAILLAATALSAEPPEEKKALEPGDFISMAARNDPYFQEILIDTLSLKYSKDLQLPARDLVLDVTGQYNLFLSGEKRQQRL